MRSHRILGVPAILLALLLVVARYPRTFAQTSDSVHIGQLLVDAQHNATLASRDENDWWIARTEGFPVTVDPASRASQAQGPPIGKKTQGPEQSSVANDLRNQAGIYLQQGKYREAEPLMKRALAIHEKTLGPDDHLSVASDLSYLAYIYWHQGKRAEAVLLLKRRMANIEKASGPDHLRVALSAEELAGALRKLGRNQEAKVYEEQAAKIRAKLKRRSANGGQNHE